MARNTVVGVFDSSAEAERAANDLVAVGVDREDIHVTSNERAAETVGGRTAEARENESLGDRIGNFFSSLFGRDDDEHATYYSEAIRRGGTVVTVHAESDEQADRVAEILDARGAIDVRDRAEQWRATGWAGSGPSTGSWAGSARNTAERDGETVIPVVKEELQIGKRARERGGVRIYSHLEETPVEENVRLREERAVVERRPVDRPATEADFAAFREGSIEVRETVEQAVVAKHARVVEEVVVGKEVTERTETVRDEVREGHVDVERMGDDTAHRVSARTDTTRAPAHDYDTDYRNHWRTNLASTGARYEDYEPAYRYGSTLAADERYRNRQWSEIEPEARRDWETRHPQSAWDRIKAAAQHGWERVTGRR